jgi:predicted nuclease of restriction endonuclease-like (RecB) superfamily
MAKKTIKLSEPDERQFISHLKEIIRNARSGVYNAINFAQVEANWLIGRQIVEQEQQGKERAKYGKQIIQLASQELTSEFGKGYSETNLKNFKKFYLAFNNLSIHQTMPAISAEKKGQALPDQSGKKNPVLLSWTHYERLLRVDNPDARNWYMKEAAGQMWSYRTLSRNISTQYYERLLSSPMKDPIIQEMKRKTGGYQHDEFEFIKNPTVLEFLGLPGNSGYTEREIEKAVIDNMQKFLMELGKGFAFVARQQLIRTEVEDYYIDLTFYNYILKCFFLIDIKTGKITHQDVGQMDMYVRMFDELKRGEGDNPTIGIVLCSDTDPDIARYSILKGSEQLFATKYQLYLPTVEELNAEIGRQREILELQYKDSE